MTIRRAYLVLAVVAVAIGVVATIQGTAGIKDPPGDSDLLSFFLPAATRVADGHPLAIYDVRAFGGYPNYNPPLAVELMGPLVALARGFDLPGARSCIASGFATLDCRALVAFVGFGFAPFVLLLGPLVLAAVRGAARWTRTSGRQAQRPAVPALELLAVGLAMLSPLLWQDFTEWWHLEQPLMLCLLVAGVWQLQAGRTPLAGVLLGLALLTRTTAAMPIVALVVLLAAAGSWRTALTTAIVAGAVVAIGIIPFLLADPSNAIYSLVTWRGSAPIGNSIWSLLSSTPLGPIVRSLDQPVAAALAVVIGFVAARRLGVGLDGPRLWGVLAIAALLVPLLSKTAWPYYYAEPFVLLVIWEVATARAASDATVVDTAGAEATAGWWGSSPAPLLAVLFLAAAATLAQFIGLHSVTNGGVVLRLMGIVQFVTVGTFALAVWSRLRAATADEHAGTATA